MVKVLFKWTYILMFKLKSKVKDTSVRYLYVHICFYFVVFGVINVYSCFRKDYSTYTFLQKQAIVLEFFFRTLQVWDFFGVRVDLNWPLSEMEIPFWLSFKFKALIKEMFVFHFGPFNVYFSFYVIWCGNKYVSIRFRIRVVGGIFRV